MKYNVVISCEHGGNLIPSFLQDKIIIPKKVLQSHRAFDKGALVLAQKFSKKLGVKPVTNTISRLVIDYNRSTYHDGLWSPYSQKLNEDDKLKLLQNYYKYRDQVKKLVHGKTLHLSFHSFTPIRNGIKRNCDFAVLYDPRRADEKNLAKLIKIELKKLNIKCRLNYPYTGISDGHTSALRKVFKADYSGLELEFNQAIVLDKTKTDQIMAVLLKVIQTY